MIDPKNNEDLNIIVGYIVLEETIKALVDYRESLTFIDDAKRIRLAKLITKLQELLIKGI